MSGFNLKYRYEQDDNPLGVIGSFTYTEKDRTNGAGDYNKGQYYGITAGPAYRLKRLGKHLRCSRCGLR
ncbi:Outer membrane protein X [Salmonella enterica subsp. enterica]|uniref:Outer membrane protein X n=1 Tax=Salmonella enterica I TaxID=59201 RepID=A0A447U6S5_SALET|nr:Outer membrane protein X [Salmonella enterica subsp. enterica]